MTLSNCWGWRFNGGVFADARPAPAQAGKEALIDNNRHALLGLLRDKIDTIRAPFLPSCRHGDSIRMAKLREAQDFLAWTAATAQPAVTAHYPLLQAVAVARNISLQEAARVVVAKAKETRDVLLETERFREQLTVAISTARSQAQLQALREWLLDRIYPELTRNFRFRTPDTEPPQPDALLGEAQRRHEIARLKVQLREVINRQRAPLHSDYIQNDELRKHKARLAQAVLSNAAGGVGSAELGLLQAYAESRRMALPAAAQLIVQSMALAADLLQRTEATRDRMLARIEGITTLRDIDAVALELDALEQASPATPEGDVA
jgi:hypothetical protein